SLLGRCSRFGRSGRLGGGLLRGSLGWSGPTGGCGALIAHDRQHATDLDGVILACAYLQQGAGHRRGDLGVDLIGGDLEQRLVDLDLIAHGLQPLSHGTLGDTFTQRRQGHLGALRAAAGGTARGGLRRCGLLLLGLLARLLARRLGLLRLLLLLGGLLLLLRSILGRALLGRRLLLGL